MYMQEYEDAGASNRCAAAESGFAEQITSTKRLPLQRGEKRDIKHQSILTTCFAGKCNRLSSLEHARSLRDHGRASSLACLKTMLIYYVIGVIDTDIA